ncbi:Translation initiation factor 5A (eIF-5A) [Pseudoloma neurophilia]|uniref:Translation initiation factor 5A (EIF-5A) n=1 Tax=Pseudoloma neurophilia TaxID=146866 RepID=A0A0R0M1M6_9MICR|nr:Translation initiation factor 5A (eIF-5A) [Pseudoloma neurophilia]
MTANIEDFDDALPANTLKPNMIIVLDASSKEYVKITSVDKVKNGKHGAAKIMITGKNVRTGNKAEVTFTGSVKVPIVQGVKTTYTLFDLDEEEDCLYAEPQTMGGQAEMITIHLNQIEKTGVELLKTTFSSIKGDEEVISFVTMEYPGFMLVESAKAVSKKSLQKRGG